MTHYATPPRFGTQPLDEGDELFELRPQVCADCGATFETSRRSSRCAVCRSLHAGLIGPCEVRCPVCDTAHRVPVLAPHRLCPTCAGDIDATAGRVQAQLQQAAADHEAAYERYTADFARADARDQQRLLDALAARETLAPEKWRQAWQRAAEKGDGLSPLVQAWQRADEAHAAVQRLERAMAEVEEARG